MVITNGACPMPPFDPRFRPCSGITGKEMRYIGKRTKAWIENKVDAKYGETYLVTDENMYYMSIDANEWVKWPAVQDSPTPSANTDIYYGALTNIPEDESCLADLTKESVKTSDMSTGITKSITADDQYITIAYKTAIGTLKSVIQSGSIESISDFNHITSGEYTIYYTSDTVYEEEGISFKFTWEIN